MSEYQEKLRDYIFAGECPFCLDGRNYIVLAHHVRRIHGITPYELREMAGLNRYTSICDPEYSKMRREKQKEMPPELLKKFIKAGHCHEVVANRETEMRPEGRKNQLDYLMSPDKIKRSVVSMNTPKARGKSKLAAQNRSPEIVKTQTERILKAHADFLSTHTKEEIRESRRQAYQTWIKNTSQEYVDEHFDKMRKMIPHEAQLKGAKAAAEIMPLYHADPAWKANWRKKFDKAMAERKKRLEENPELKKEWADKISITKLSKGKERRKV